MLRGCKNMKRLGLGCIIGIVLILSSTISVTGSLKQKGIIADVLIYTDVGTWDEGVTAFEKFLEFKDLTWYECDDSYIENNNLIGLYNAIHFPGGSSAQYNAQINEDGLSHIRDFVAAGGGYLGICAGSSFACDRVIWQGETYDYPLDLFAGVGYGPIEEIAPWPTYTITSIAMNASNPINQYEPSSEDIMYYGGDSFYADEGQEMQVIGTYDLYNNDPAVINFQYGEGRVVLFGPHPEIEEDSTRDEVSFADHLEDLGTDWDLLWTTMDWILGHVISEPPETLPPDIPSINGPVLGIKQIDYNYSIITSDPELEEIYYKIDWDDGDIEEWIGPYDSNEEITVTHQWAEKGSYLIKVKAKDCNDVESDWATLEVVMPVNQQLSHPLFHWFLERFSNAFPILRQLLGL